MSRFCSSPTSNMLRVKYFEGARERRNQRKNRASWCCFSVVSVAFLIQQAKKAPHKAAWSNPDTAAHRLPGRRILAEEAAWSNPDRIRSAPFGPDILAEEAAWSNPDRQCRFLDSGLILAEEAAWSNPDQFRRWGKGLSILAEEAAWSNPDQFRRRGKGLSILAEEAAWSNPDVRKRGCRRIFILAEEAAWSTRRKRPGFQRRPGGESPPKRTVRPRSLERSGSRMEQSGFKPPTGQSFPSVGFRTDRRADLSTLRKHRP